MGEKNFNLNESIFKKGLRSAVDDFVLKLEKIAKDTIGERDLVEQTMLFSLLSIMENTKNSKFFTESGEENE